MVGVGGEEAGVGFGGRVFSVVDGFSRGFSVGPVSAGGFDANIGDLFHPSGDLLHFGGAEAAGGNSGRTEADAGRAEGSAFIVGEGIGVQGEADTVEGGFVEFAVEAEATADINEDEVVLGAVALEFEAEILKFGGESLSVFDDFLGVIMEFGLEIFLKSDGFCGDDMLEGTALGARKNGAVDESGDVFEGMVDFFQGVTDAAHGEDEATAGTTEGFMGGSSHDVKAVLERVRVDAAGDEAGDVGHVGHEETIRNRLGDFADTVEIGDFHEGGVADEDDFGLMFGGEALELVVVDVAIVGDAVADEIVNFCATSDGGAVSEMAAGGEGHGEDGVAGLTPGKIDGFVSISAGVWLDIGVVGSEKLFRALDR